MCCSIGLLLPVLGFLAAGPAGLAMRNLASGAIFVGSVMLPAAAVMSFLAVFDAMMSGTGRWLRAYAAAVSIAALIMSGYLSAWGMIAFRPWAY